MVSAKPAQGAEPVQCSGAAKIKPPFEMGVDNFDGVYLDVEQVRTYMVQKTLPLKW